MDKEIENISISQENAINNQENLNSLKNQNILETNFLNNRNILNYIYGDDIFVIIDELSKFKENSKAYLKATQEELNIKYNFFETEVLKYINSTTNKIINAFRLDISNLDEETRKIVQELVKEKIIFINKVITLYKQITEIIKQNFLILKNFLDNFDLNKEFPIQDFFKKEFNNITTSWLFLKLDLEKFDFKNIIEESNLNQNYKDFLMKECHEKSSFMNIILPENKENDTSNLNIINYKELYKEEINLLSENSNHLVKLNMKNVPVIEDFLGKSKYDKLEKLNLKNSNITDNKIFNQFSSLTKLSIKYCPDLDTSIFNDINLLNLKYLILEKNGFIDQDLDNLISNFILKSPDLIDNLEILSFAYNNLSNIDFNHYLTTPKHVFNSLNSLILNHNELYKITIDKYYFPELKLLDCSNNNLNSYYFSDLQNDDILILQSGNFFLMDDSLCQIYYSNIRNKLANTDYLSLRKLDLSYMPTLFSNSFLSNININHSLFINLKKLNLSYNGISCDTLFNFFEKNKECLKLRTLNLNGNQLDDTFFERFLNLGLNKIFSNLKKLYLNDNNIGCNDEIDYKDEEPISKKEYEKDIYKLRLMYKFICENKNLKLISINKNPISEKNIVMYEDIINEEDKEGLLIKNKNGEIIINDFYSFLIKIKNELTERNDLNIKFDCLYDVNFNSKDFNYESQYIKFQGK
jgi:hypothetical protein